MIAVRLVGTFAVERDGVEIPRADLGSRKSRELLKLLAVERGHPVPVADIAAVLWPVDQPADPAANVATLVSRLRRAVGAALIDAVPGSYQLGAEPAVSVDLDEAGRWLTTAERRLVAGEAALAVSAAERAADRLAAAAVLPEDPTAEWAEPARAELVELSRRCRRVLADAALGTGDFATAAAVASAAVAADPLDEPARRALMRAHLGAGEPARALATFAELQDILDAELGAYPAAQTQALHVAILQGQPPPVAAPAGAAPPETLGLVGRLEPLRRLREAWNGAAARRPSLVVVAGEAGIGKTRLAEELAGIAVGTGGTVLAARCYAAERSLFLQPVAEALAGVVRTLPAHRMVALAGDHAQTLAGLLPDAVAALGAPAARRDQAELEHRRAFEALTALLRGLADEAPVLLSLDDVQNAGRSTIELIHYLARHLSNARLLMIITVREEEGRQVLDALEGVADRLDLGPLPLDAVTRLAAESGLADRAPDIMGRTRGHPLYVVETLRALRAGLPGVPESLEAAVVARVERAGEEVTEVLRAASVLGVSFEPATVAGLLDRPLAQVVSTCADALAARLVVVSGRDYEFANDLIRDVLYATTPAPTRHVFHGRAADLLTARPEAVALHATETGDWPRAARAWLVAGEGALARAAVGDAIEMQTRSIEAADRLGDVEIRARALLLRGRAHAAAASYPAALADIEQAVADARVTGDRRLELIALRALGGEVPSAMGRPVAESIRHLERGLALAASLPDRAMEADIQAWLAVLSTNDLQFTAAVEHGRLAVLAGRAAGDHDALAAALDGQKTSLAYLGDTAALATVLDELEPLLRRTGDLFRLHWAIFESAFIPVAAGDWTTAAARIESALEVNRRSGFTAYAAWHVAHLGWLARLTGDLERALALGAEATALSGEAPHRWCQATAGALYGATALEAGRVDEAVTILETARLAATEGGGRSYLLRTLAPLAEATGDLGTLVEADALLHSIVAPPGQAFLAGDACYLAVARSWLTHGDPVRARAALAPLLTAAAGRPWVGALAQASLVDGQAALALGETAAAEQLLTRAVELGTRYELPQVARDAEALRAAR